MIVVRDIIQYASTRKMEWIMTGLMIHLGLRLIAPDAFLLTTPAYASLLRWMGEHYWAWTLIGLGVFRLIVLILNGTHIKQSSELRTATSALGFVLFSIWVWGFDSSGLASISGISFKWLALGELMNVWQASADTFAKRALRNAGSSRHNT